MAKPKFHIHTKPQAKTIVLYVPISMLLEADKNTKGSGLNVQSITQI
jgi:hypothetical protein